MILYMIIILVKIFIKEIKKIINSKVFKYYFVVFCVPDEECHDFLIARDRLRKLDKSTAEYSELLQELKGIVCDKKQRKICCEGKIM